MNLQDQVTNLELSKKMKDLGFPQESLFYWRTPREDRNIYGDLIYKSFAPHLQYGGNGEYSAYTVAELGTLLPKTYMSFHDSLDHWYCEDLDTFINPQYKSISYETEANARAAMLVYLKENNLIDPKNI